MKQKFFNATALVFFALNFSQQAFSQNETATYSCQQEVPNGSWPDRSFRLDQFIFTPEVSAPGSWTTFINLSNPREREYDLQTESVAHIPCSGFFSSRKTCFSVGLVDVPPEGIAIRWRFQLNIEQSSNGTSLISKIFVKDYLSIPNPSWEVFGERKKGLCTKAF